MYKSNTQWWYGVMNLYGKENQIIKVCKIDSYLKVFWSNWFKFIIHITLQLNHFVIRLPFDNLILRINEFDKTIEYRWIEVHWSEL